MDETDYYKFTLAEGKDLSLSISGSSVWANATLYYDANANGLVDSNEYEAAASGFTSTITAATRSLQPGQYFIRVEASNSTRYEMKLDLGS